MGEVIALPPSRKTASRVPESGSAEILFFTGVRYYRLSDEEFARLAQTSLQPGARRSAKPKAAAPAGQKPASASRKLKRLG